MTWQALTENAITGLVAGTFALVGVYISNRLSFKRSFSEKIWDLRRAAYGEILAALFQVENVLDIATSYIQENAFAYFHGEGDYSGKHDQRIGESMSVARKRFSNDYLVLSESFVSRFEEMEKRLSAISEDPDLTPDLSHAEFDEAIRKYRPLLVEIARNEILKARGA